MLELHTGGTVKETITHLDGIVDLIRAGVILDLPQSKADQGHFMAVVQFDSGSRHGGGMKSQIATCRCLRDSSKYEEVEVLRYGSARWKSQQLTAHMDVLQ